MGFKPFICGAVEGGVLVVGEFEGVDFCFPETESFGVGDVGFGVGFLGEEVGQLGGGGEPAEEGAEDTGVAGVLIEEDAYGSITA